MIFSSTIFVFGFLPLFLITYYVVPKQAKSWVILLGSYAFYAWWRVDYLAVVFSLSFVSYLAAQKAYHATTDKAHKWAVNIGVTFDLAVLGYFKYTMFFMGGFSDLSVAFGGIGVTVPSIILPIGISFHTFQSISYIIDVARRDAPPARRLVDFLAFGSLFPQLIAGPVLRYKDLAHQFEDRIHSVEKFVNGIKRFVQGLAMKLLIADNAAPLADRIFATTSPSGAEAWLGILAYTVQLFFDFAGYSAMAIGLGLMIGFRFIENFNAPYISCSITEFWRRWHISLSQWLRDYLYLSLGGNRKGTVRTYINLMLTMVLGGLWHGANWTFILWGIWHGTWLAVERKLGAKSGSSVWPRMIAWPLTMLLVMIGWVMFRASSVGQAFDMYQGMFGGNGWAISNEIAWQIQNTELVAVGLGLLISLYSVRLMQWVQSIPNTLHVAGRASVLFLTCMALIAQSHSPFLYFQF